MDENINNPEEANEKYHAMVESERQNKLRIMRILFAVVLIAEALIYTYVAYGYKDLINLIVLSLPAAAIFGFFPLINSLIKYFRKKKEDPETYRTYIIISTILFALVASANCGSKTTSENSDFYRVSDNNTSSIFDADEYTVEFAGNPSVSDVETTLEGVVLKGIKAEYGVPSENSMQRIEYVNAGEEFLRKVNKEQIMFALETASAVHGLKYSSREYFENDLGKIGILSGVKNISTKNHGTVLVKYELRFVYGSRVMLNLTVGASADDFPTSAIKKFLNSLKKK